MSLKAELQSRRSKILARWVDLALEVYPEETVRFMKREKDRFQNPVGARTSDALGALLDGLIAGRTPGELAEPIDELVRIRALQDLPPSRALACLFLLRRVLRDELEGPVVLEAERSGLFEAIEQLGLAAFDAYMDCREQVYRLRANEIRRNAATLLERLEEDSKGHSKGGNGA